MSRDLAIGVLIGFVVAAVVLGPLLALLKTFVFIALVVGIAVLLGAVVLSLGSSNRISGR